MAAGPDQGSARYDLTDPLPLQTALIKDVGPTILWPLPTAMISIEIGRRLHLSGSIVMGKPQGILGVMFQGRHGRRGLGDDTVNS